MTDGFVLVEQVSRISGNGSSQVMTLSRSFYPAIKPGLDTIADASKDVEHA